MRPAALLTAIALCAAVSFAEAGEFVINPLRVALDRTSRASEVVVRNDGTAPLRMQVEGMAWRQDETGVDRYEASDGLLYFPRVLEIPAGESRVIRVGVKAAPVSREDTYRLFIEELPPPVPPKQSGTSLQVLLRVGVPVFVAPAQRSMKAEITRIDATAGNASFVVANEGTVHVRADEVTLAGLARDGRRLFVHTFSERYFLAGVTKTLTVEIPRESCRELATVEATVLAEDVDLRRKVDVVAPACA